MTFFYDLNKRLADLANKQDAKQLAEHTASAPRSKSKLAESMGVAEADYSAKKAAAGKDIGKPGKNFSKIAKSSGGGEKGQRIAGAVLAKLRSKNESTDQDGDVMDYLNDKLKDFDAQQSKTDESALQAYLGKKKYGNTGMKALQKAGREGASKETMARIRAKHDKMDEADMEEGNAFTAALKSTPKGGKFKVGGKEFTDTSDLEEGFADMNAWLAQREKEKGTGRFDRKERTLPSGMKATTYTRKPETFDDPETDPEATGGAPKRRGRPKGKDKGPERVTAKSYKYKAGRPAKTAEGVDHGEYDREGDMAKEQMHTIMSAAKELHGILRDEENLPEWVQKKITLAKEYIDTARDYMLSQHAERAEEPVAEKAPPGAKAERMVKGIKKSLSKDGQLSDKDKAIAYATTWKAKKAGKVEEEGNDGNLANNAKPYDKVTQGDVVAGRLGKDEMGGKKKKEDKVDETTVSGSVATAPATSNKSSGGMQFGKGVYEGFNNQVESMITEGMSINVSVDDNGQKSINITATDEDAEMLSQLLKMAGLSSSPKAEVCPGCGSADCGCEKELDENSPDWPTNTETSDNALQYSGGLNGPKSTGQTTTPVIASQLRRQVSMEENVELERSLFKTWKNYKG